ncbi:lipoprotein [Streptomyces avidinii]
MSAVPVGRRPALGRAAPLLALPLLLPFLAGCGDDGGLASAGATPTASGPVHLWPGREGAVVPPADPGGAPPEYVPGIAPVRDQNVHEIDPVALVQAEVRAHPGSASGPDGMPAETARAVTACGTDGADPKACPVLAPYYRDLTGNGRDELIIGIEFPERQMSVRAYTADPDGRLNRIMATTDTVISVELAGQDVILRIPSGNAGYEVNTTWSWDGKQRSMLPAREQIVRVPPNAPAPTSTAAPATPGPGTATGPGTAIATPGASP